MDDSYAIFSFGDPFPGLTAGRLLSVLVDRLPSVFSLALRGKVRRSAKSVVVA